MKYLNYGIRPNTTLIIQRSQLYKSWKTKLKQAKLKPIISIIDKVDQLEEVFWFTHYQDLFRSWGYKLLPDIINEHIRESSRPSTFELQKYLSSHSDFPKFERKVLHLETLVRILKLTISNGYKSKEVDSFSLQIILVFFYGMSLSEISRFSFSGIWDFINNCRKRSILFRFDKLETFIHNYVVIYLDNDQMNKDTQIDIGISTAKDFNKKLSDVFSHFGFNQSFNYHDRNLISKLLLFKTKVKSTLDRKILENVLEIEEKNLLYELVNRTKSKYVIISEDSEIYREVLCSEQ